MPEWVYAVIGFIVLTAIFTMISMRQMNKAYQIQNHCCYSHNQRYYAHFDSSNAHSIVSAIYLPRFLYKKLAQVGAGVRQ